MIYLASAYSHRESAVMEQRFDAACRAAGKLMAAGHLVYSPIAHTHPIAVRCSLPLEWEYWERFDRAMVERCDEVVVLNIDGYAESKGVAAEIAIARSMLKPVTFWDGVSLFEPAKPKQRQIQLD